MKKWKKRLLICLIVFLVLGVSGVGVYEYYVKPTYIKPLMETAAKFFESDENMDAIISILQEELQDGGLAGLIAESEGVQGEEKGTMGEQSSPNEKTKDAQGRNLPTQSTDNKEVKNTGMNVNDLEKQISLKDKTEGLMIATKLNMPYLIGITKDGVTDQEKEAVKEHLKQALTSEEYEKMKNLVVKYAHLLKEN